MPSGPRGGATRAGRSGRGRRQLRDLRSLRVQDSGLRGFEGDGGPVSADCRGRAFVWSVRLVCGLTGDFTASHWIKKDSLGGAVRWRARDCAGGRRLCGAFESQDHGEEPVPPAGLCNGGWGWVALSAGGRCLWSPLSRIPRRCRRPEGTIPAWRYPAGSHAAVVGLRSAGHHRPGPGRAGWQSPPTATRDPGPPHLWEGSPSLVHDDSPPRVRREVDPVHTTGVVSRIPRRCRRAKPSWPGRWCPAERFRRPAGVIRLDTTGPACFPQATTATRDPGRRRPQAAAAAQQRDPAPPPVAEARRRHRLFTMGLTFQAPTRPPAASAAHCTPPNCATQRILLKPVRSRKIACQTTDQTHQHTSRNHPPAPTRPP